MHYLVTLIMFSLATNLSSQDASWLDDYSDLESQVLEDKKRENAAIQSAQVNENFARFSPKLSVDPVDDMTVLVDWTHIKGQPLNVSIYNEAGKLFHLRKISNKIPKILLSSFHLKPGRYMVELITDESAYMLKTFIY